MDSVLSLKMMAVLALVLLVSSMNEGRVLSKCELKAHLDAAQFQVMPDNMTLEELVARLVCKANSSGFKTDTFVIDNHEDHKLEVSPLALPSHGPSQVPSKGPSQDPSKGPSQDPSKGPSQVPSKGPSQDPSKGPSQVPSKGPSQAPPKGPSQAPPKAPINDPHRGAPRKPKRSDPQTKKPKHQFGLFQLSDEVACDSGLVPSLNVCKMSCTDLIDDNITDDIACVKTLINSVEQRFDSPHVPTLETLLVKECRHVVPSKYFSECV